MTTVQSRACGAALPIRTRLGSTAASIGACLLGLQLAASTPPAWADGDLNDLVFEAQLLADTRPALPPAAPGPDSRQRQPTAQAPTQPGTLLARIADQNQRVAAIVEQEGPFAVPLEQEYLGLARLYQELGRHEEALEVFADAEYVSRVNAGLENHGLFNIIEASLPSHLAQGELQEVASKQRTLYSLARAQYGHDSAELLPLLTRLGDWQMTSFVNAVRQPVAPTVSIGGGGNVDTRRLGFANLFIAQRYYSEGVSNLLQRQELYSPELMALEQKFVQTVFLGANREGLLDNPDFYLGHHRSATGSRVRHRELRGFSASFINGRAAYQRMQIYARFQRLPLLEQARLLVAEADWHLMYQHHGTARRIYQQAWQLLQTDRVAPQDSAALFTPELPVQLPTFMALPHSRGHFGLEDSAALQWAGWIDVRFELSRYGKPRKLKVLDSSAGTDSAVTGRLRRLLMASPFRPRIAPEDTADAAHVYRLRYNYTWADVMTGD